MNVPYCKEKEERRKREKIASHLIDFVEREKQADMIHRHQGRGRGLEHVEVQQF